MLTKDRCADYAARRLCAVWLRKKSSLLILIAFIATLSVATHAQTYQGGLRGSVRDGSGKVLPAVTLTLVNAATNATRNTLSNEAGEYAFERLDPGQYKISASHAGFKKLDRANIVIETQQQITLDLSLSLGAVTESVIITDAIPLLETSNPSVGQVINKQLLSDLPNSGRNPFSLAALSPNYIPAGNPTFNRQQDQSGSSQISLAGGPVRANNYLFDGVPIADLGNRAVIIPTFEAVQELKLQVNNYDAEAGRTGGGVFNVTGRSGTNQLHGSLFGFLRPTELQANNFFANRSGIARPNLPYKLYGGSLGGPVKIPWLYDGKNRTFFWAAFEGYRMTSFLSETFTVPTELERQGDFSQTKSSGQPVVIYDPLTTRTVNGQLVRDPFTGNVVPLNRQDPVGRALMQYFPKPNRAADAAGRNNYAATGTLDDRADQQTIKLDHAFSEKYKFAGTYLRYGSQEPVADYYQTIANPGGSLLFRNVHALAINNLITLSETALLSVRYGFNTFRDDPTTISAGFEPAQLGFANSFIRDIVFKKFPRINVSGYGSTTQGALGSSAPSERDWYSQNFLVDYSKLLGRHSLKTGFDYRRLSVDFIGYGQASGEFSFTRAFTQGPNPNQASATGGNELASLLLGTPASGSALVATPLSVYVNYFAGYVQDDFRLSQRLTINLGLRYEYEQGMQERNNQLTVGFDPQAASPLQVPGLNLKGGLLFAGVNGAPTQQVKPQKTKFAPRLGFAYSLNDKTTLRAGYGLFWSPVQYSLGPSVTGYGALGFSASTDMVTSLDGGLTPANYLSNPFPTGLLKPSGSALGLLTQLGQTVDFVDQHRRGAYVQQYSLDIQRKLPGDIALTLTYVGSRGTHLQIGGISNGAININQLAPEFMARTDLQQQVPNPFFGTAGAVGLLRGATVARAQLLRPFPQFGNVLMRGTSGANSVYNAFTIKTQKRLSQGVSFVTSYTFSKLLDSVTGQSNFFAVDSTTDVINAYNFAGEYSLSGVDTPHRFLFSGGYELPFGQGKPLLDGGAWLDKVVGGWQLNANIALQSGFPLSLGQAVNNTNAFSLGQRPNVVAGAQVATAGSLSQRIDGYLHAAAFTLAPANTFGNAPRTLGVRSPGQRNVDLSILKNTALFERLKAQFRLEAINAFNTPIFRAPNTSLGNANFGRITAQANFARVVQLSVRLMW